MQGIRPLGITGKISKSQIHRRNYLTDESIRIYRATKLFTGNQPKAHQAAIFERILRSTATAKLPQCNTGAWIITSKNKLVQGSQQLATKGGLIPHGKASTDHVPNEYHTNQEHICYRIV